MKSPENATRNGLIEEGGFREAIRVLFEPHPTQEHKKEKPHANRH